MRLFDFITFEGESWQVIAQDGPRLSLKNLTTLRIRKVPVSDLLGDESFVPDSPDRLPRLDDVAVLDTLSPAVRERTLWLYRHVCEVLTGVVPVREDDETLAVPRPEYDSAIPIGERIQAKVTELVSVGTPMAERTLWRHITSYRREGIAGLVDHRLTRQPLPGRRTDPRLVALLERELARQTNLSTGTRTRLMSIATLAARKEGIPVPSTRSLYRVLSNLEGSRHPFGNATTRRTQANRPGRTFGRHSVRRPGEVVEIDSTPLDLMVVFPDSSTGRVDLTVALDIATRTPLAAVLRPVATKSVDAAVLLAKAMTPPVVQPGWVASMGFSRSVLPPGMLPSQQDVAAAFAAKPVIVPESITMDRGKVYVGTTFLAACERLQISVVKAAPRTPTDKPHIERFFHALNTGFTQFLDGYTGPNVVRRGTDPASTAAWTLPEVQNLLDWWIAAIWQNRPHDGLRLAAMPNRTLTPNEMYAALVSVAPQVSVQFTRDDYIALMPVTWRSIQSYGINFHGLVYDSDEIHEYRGMSSNLPAPAAGKWEVRYDPYRMQTIHVRDHLKGRWIDAQWTLAGQTLAPFSLDVLKAARKAIGRRGELVPGSQILAEINRIQTQGATTTETRAARRSAATAPLVPDLETVKAQSFQPTPEPVSLGRVARRIDNEE